MNVQCFASKKMKRCLNHKQISMNQPKLVSVFLRTVRILEWYCNWIEVSQSRWDFKYVNLMWNFGDKCSRQYNKRDLAGSSVLKNIFHFWISLIIWTRLISYSPPPPFDNASLIRYFYFNHKIVLLKFFVIVGNIVIWWIPKNKYWMRLPVQVCPQWCWLSFG